MSFFQELKRRQVFRVAIAYLALAWLLIEVTGTLFPAFGIPGWAFRLVVILLALGFVPVLVFSWAYEMTPEGVKREQDLMRDATSEQRTARRLDFLTIGLILVALGFIAVDRLWFGSLLPGEEIPAIAEPDASAESPAIPQALHKSIAVLPFTDMTQAGNQEWFADGLAEEILNALTRTPDLRVASPLSSFQYKGKNEDVATIAASLGVAHILSGSVRRGEDRLRVTAQLTRASDGVNLWSESFDREPQDVIEIQENIATEIASALQTAMDPEALRKMVASGTASVAAHEAYLKGLDFLRRVRATGDQEYRTAALEEFERAVEIDRKFSEAHWWRSEYWRRQYEPTLNGFGLSKLPRETIKANRDESIAAAIETEEDETLRLKYQVRQAQYELRFKDAISLGHEYLEAYPNDLLGLAQHLETHLAITDTDGARQHLPEIESITHDDPEVLGLMQEHLILLRLETAALDIARRLIAKYPQEAVIAYQAHRVLLWNGQLDEARQLLVMLRRSNWPQRNIKYAELRQACAEGDQGTAQELVNAVLTADYLDGVEAFLTLQIMGRPDEAHQRLATQGFDQDALAGFLYYPYFDHTRFPELAGTLEAQGIDRRFIKAPPYACAKSG